MRGRKMTSPRFDVSIARTAIFLSFFSPSNFLQNVQSQEQSKPSRQYDIVVYGGTAGGVAAAVQGARMGKSVVLIEPGRPIGGLPSGRLGPTDIGQKAAIGRNSPEFLLRPRPP